MSNFQLLKKIIIRGEIEATSGLLIGGSNTSMGIGGPDKMVIRNPISNEPYIPGSSIKGKMRSLLEVSFGYIMQGDMGKNIKYIPNNNPDLITTLLFGSAHPEVEKQRPSRVIFRDGKLLNGDSFRDKTDLPFTETKTEVVIDRITSAAMPRTFERVPAGAKFDLEIVLNIYRNDPHSENELVKLTLNGLQLIQDDYLGGSGSRGSGRVKFTIKTVKERSHEFYHGTAEEKDYSYAIPKDLRDATN